MNTDPIADLLTRIRNASNAKLVSCNMPYSKIKENILNILQEKKFIEKYEVSKEGQFPELVVTLDEKKDITLQRMSKPGQRIYVKKADLKPLRSGLGIRIISTSKGLMTSEQAIKQNLGGEILCEIF